MDKTNTMDTFTIELTWDEYTTMIAAVSAVKNMVDSPKMDALYIKVTTEYKGKK